MQGNTQSVAARSSPASGTFYATLAALGLLVVLGLYAWIVQMRDGIGVTGLNDHVTWGLYIVNFEFFVGVATGSILLAAITYAFDVARFRAVARLATLVGFVALALGGVSIMASMGRPDRAWTLLVYGSWGSPLVWDVFMVSTSLVLFGAMLYFATRADLARGAIEHPRRAWPLKLVALGRTSLTTEAIEHDRKWITNLSFLAIPYAIGLHSVTAWIFGLVKARPAWHSTLLAPLYVASAIVSGIALVLVIAILARWFLRAKISTDAILGLAKIMLFALPVLGYFLFAELLTVTFGGVPDEAIFFDDMMWGQYAWVFWFNLFGGIVLPMALLALPKWRAKTGAVLVASILVALGVYAERFNLVVIPQFHKLLAHTHGSYSPTWVEIALTMAVVAALGLGVMLFSRLVPLAEEEGETVVIGR